MKCEVNNFLAQFMFVYLVASIIYIIATRFIDTPFRDSLTKAQVEIKKKSSRKRGYIFLGAFLGGILILLVFKPFKECYK
jgi:hypothetical protein